MNHNIPCHNCCNPLMFTGYRPLYVWVNTIRYTHNYWISMLHGKCSTNTGKFTSKGVFQVFDRLNNVTMFNPTVTWIRCYMKHTLCEWLCCLIWLLSPWYFELKIQCISIWIITLFKPSYNENSFTYTRTKFAVFIQRNHRFQRGFQVRLVYNFSFLLVSLRFIWPVHPILNL